MKKTWVRMICFLLCVCASAASAAAEPRGITVRIEKGRYEDTPYVAAFVTVESADQMKTALAGKRFQDGKARKAVEIARDAGALIAVNGDDFALRKRSFTWRNGVKFRENPEEDRDVLIIDPEGNFHPFRNYYALQKAGEGYRGDIAHSFSFGPALVIDGERQTGFVDLGFGMKRHAQRMAIAQMDALSYLLIASEGPEEKDSVGLTLEAFADLVHSFHPKQAYNLDGGTTATLVYEGKKINAVDNPKQRWVNDILYFVEKDARR